MHTNAKILLDGLWTGTKFMDRSKHNLQLMKFQAQTTELRLKKGCFETESQPENKGDQLSNRSKNVPHLTQ